MKILFITDNFPPEVNAPATRTYEHCTEWAKQGADVTVITGFPNFPKGKVYKGYKNSWKKIEYINNIKVIRVWTYIAENKGFAKRILDYISFSVTSFFAGLHCKADVIIATSPQLFSALSGRTLSFFTHTPWIMEVRDLWPESIKTVGAMKDSIFIKYFEKEAKWCYKSAKHIITVTDAFKEKIKNENIDDKKISVIKNGANLNLFKPKPKNDKIIETLKLKGKTIFGYIGTHGMAHKLDFILDCVKNLNKTNYHFLFIGDGAEKENLKKKVKKENITNVTMLNSVSKIEIVEYLSVLDVAIINLKKSDLFKTVIPSKIFETAAMQIPILLGVEGEAKNIIEQFDAGLCYEPENKNDFIDKIHKILDPNIYKQKQEGAKKLALTFDRSKLAKDMLNLINNII